MIYRSDAGRATEHAPNLRRVETEQDAGYTKAASSVLSTSGQVVFAGSAIEAIYASAMGQAFIRKYDGSVSTFNFPESGAFCVTEPGADGEAKIWLEDRFDESTNDDDYNDWSWTASVRQIPVVSIEAVDAEATESTEDEPVDQGQFVISRTGDVSNYLDVYFTVGGTAIEGDGTPGNGDYDQLPGSIDGQGTFITIPAGQTSVVIDLKPIDDEEAEGVETAEIEIDPAPVSNNGPAYVLAAPQPATRAVAVANINDNVSVKNVSIGRLVFSPRISGAVAFAFTNKIDISGEHLDQVEVRMMIKSSTGMKTYEEGRAMTPDEILAKYPVLTTNPVLLNTGGQFEVDDQWDWQSIDDIGQNQGVGNKGDEQRFTAPHDTANIQGELFEIAQLSTVQRDFRLEFRKKGGDGTVIKTLEWGYKWSNQSRLWPIVANPEPPVIACASDSFGAAPVFTDVYGHTGI
jgi:hypothetical protein